MKQKTSKKQTSAESQRPKQKSNLSKFSVEDISDYVLGEMSIDRARSLELIMQSDPSLALQVEDFKAHLPQIVDRLKATALRMIQNGNSKSKPSASATKPALRVLPRPGQSNPNYKTAALAAQSEDTVAKLLLEKSVQNSTDNADLGICCIYHVRTSDTSTPNLVTFSLDLNDPDFDLKGCELHFGNATARVEHLTRTAGQALTDQAFDSLKELSFFVLIRPLKDDESQKVQS